MKKLCLFVLFFITAWITLDSLISLSLIYNTVSITAVHPILIQHIELCDKYAAENFLLFTYCSDEEIIVNNDLKEAQTKAIRFNGDADSAFGARYLYGEPPAPLDFNSCSVSRELAHSLYGSDNIIGLSLFVGDHKYIIRGVLDGHGEKIALLNSEQKSGFSRIEIKGFKGSKSEAAQKMLNACEISSNQIIYGSSIQSGAWALILLPSLALVYPLFLAIAGTLKKASAKKREVIIFIVVFCAALALPLIFQVIPNWFIPAKLSSGEAWAQIFISLKSEYLAYLSSTPSFKDVIARALIIKASIFSISAVTVLAVMKAKSANLIAHRL